MVTLTVKKSEQNPSSSAKRLLFSALPLEKVLNSCVFWKFLGIAEAIARSLLCCVGAICECTFQSLTTQTLTVFSVLKIGRQSREKYLLRKVE